MKNALRHFGIAALAGLALAACDDADDVTGLPEGQSDFGVVLRPAPTASGLAPSPTAATTGPARAQVDLDRVSSIILPIGNVQAKSAGGGWLDAGDVNADVDLLALPEDGIVLVDGSLPEGDYTALRFFLDGDATITLDSDLLVGRSLFEAGTHPLEIPSSEQTGLKLNADFVVDADGELLTVIFDGDASVRHVTATGSGVLKISPVLSVTNEEGEDVGGEIDDDEDDDEPEVEFEGDVSAVTASGFTLDDGTVVVIGAETEIEGDILTLAAVAAALANDEVVEAEGEGDLDTDGTTVLATKVEFETDDDDGDGDPDDEDEEGEVEGLVTSVDRASLTFTVEEDGVTTEVVVTSTTEIDDDGDFTDFAAMADAFDAGTAVEAEAEGEFDEEGRLVAAEVEFEIHEEEFEGPLVAVDPGEEFDALTVEVETGVEVVVLVTAETEIDAAGDFTLLDAVYTAFDAGQAVKVEGRGQVDAEGRIVADVVKFETD